MKLTTLTRRGDRLESLKALAVRLAKKLDDPDLDEKTLPQIAKQYRETVREIEEIKGAMTTDDEIGSILSARAADGKPGAVRKDRA